MTIFLALSTLWHALWFNPQMFPFPGNRPLSGGGSPPAFVQASSGDSSSATNISTNTATSASGDLIFAFGGGQQSCASFGGANAAIQEPACTAGSCSFTPIIPTIGATSIGAHLDTVGSGYTQNPDCAITGGNNDGLCATTETGGSVDSFSLSGVGTGFTPASPAVITITPHGGTGGSGATAHVTAYGIGNSSTQCTSAWYAKNITGGASNQVKMTWAPTTGYIGITAIELSGASASAPFQVGASAKTSAASITSDSFASGSAGSTVVCGSRVEALSQTWTPGTGYTLPSAATTPQTFMAAEYQVNLNPSGTTPAISSGNSVDRELICAAFK
jgi:hypothetical protein